MKKALIPLGVFLVLVVFLAIGLTRDPRVVPSPLIDKAAPVFVAPLLHTPEKQFSAQDMRGKVWLLNVWASWCTACLQEHPVLMEYAKSKNIPLIGLFTRMLTIPLWFLAPAIAAVSAVGVYAVHSTTFDLLLMVGLGVLGYIMRKMHFPMSPLILGFVLGEMLEQNLRRALSITDGDVRILAESPISIGLWVLSALMLVVPPLMRLRARAKAR